MLREKSDCRIIEASNLLLLCLSLEIKKNKGFMVQWAGINAKLLISLCFYYIYLLLLSLKTATFALKSPYFYY